MYIQEQKYYMYVFYIFCSGNIVLCFQLCATGESIGLKKGGEVELRGLRNIYLPQLVLLAKTTMRIGMTTLRQLCIDIPLTFWLGVCSKPIILSIKLMQLNQPE